MSNYNMADAIRAMNTHNVMTLMPEVLAITEQPLQGLKYRTNARYRNYRDKRDGYTNAMLTAIDQGTRLEVQLERTRTKALVDTGATVSIVSTQLLDRIKTRRKIKVAPWTHPPIRTADQGKITPIGITTLTVRAGHKTQSHPFVVIDWKSYGLIIGRDFIQKTCMNISIWKQKVTFGKDPRSVPLVVSTIPKVVASATLFSLDTVTLPPMSQVAIDCVTAKASPFAYGFHDGWITTHELPTNQRGLLAEKGFQTLGEGKTRIALSNLSNETQTIKIGQTVAKFVQETAAEEEVFVINNLSLEEDDQPASDTVANRDAVSEMSTERVSQRGMTKSLMIKRSREHARLACPMTPTVEIEGPSCLNPREAADATAGRDLIDVRDAPNDDTERDAPVVSDVNLGTTSVVYETGDRRRIQGAHIHPKDRRGAFKKASGSARRKIRESQVIAVVEAKELDPLHEINFSESSLTKPQQSELRRLLTEFRDIFAKNPKRPGRTDNVLSMLRHLVHGDFPTSTKLTHRPPTFRLTPMCFARPISLDVAENVPKSRRQKIEIFVVRNIVNITTLTFT